MSLFSIVQGVAPPARQPQSMQPQPEMNFPAAPASEPISLPMLPQVPQPEMAVPGFASGLNASYTPTEGSPRAARPTWDRTFTSDEVQARIEAAMAGLPLSDVSYGTSTSTSGIRPANTPMAVGGTQWGVPQLIANPVGLGPGNWFNEVATPGGPGRWRPMSDQELQQAASRAFQARIASQMRGVGVGSNASATQRDSALRGAETLLKANAVGGMKGMFKGKKRSKVKGMMHGGEMGDMSEHHEEEDDIRRKIEITLEGFMDGGTANIPGFGWGGSFIDKIKNLGKSNDVTYQGSQGSVGLLLMEYPREMFPGTDAQYQAFISDLATKADAEGARSAAAGAPGVDHFYEQLAEEARQFNLQRQDERALADWQAKVAQEQGRLDWQKAMADSETARRQTQTDAAGTSMNVWADLVGQMNPEGAPMFFNPNALVDSIKNTQGYQMQMPNIPGVQWQ